MSRKDYLAALLKETLGLAYNGHEPVFLASNDFAGAVAHLQNGVLYGKVVVSTAMSDKDGNVLPYRWLVFSLRGKIVQVVDLHLFSENWITVPNGQEGYLEPLRNGADFFKPFQNDFDVMFDEVYLTNNIAGVSELVTTYPARIEPVAPPVYRIDSRMSAIVQVNFPQLRYAENVPADDAAWLVQPTRGYDLAHAVGPVDNSQALSTETPFGCGRFFYSLTFGGAPVDYSRGTFVAQKADGSYFFPEAGHVYQPADLGEPGALLKVWSTGLASIATGYFYTSNADSGNVPSAFSELNFASYGLSVPIPVADLGQGFDLAYGASYSGRMAANVRREGVYTIKLKNAANADLKVLTVQVDTNGYFTFTMPARSELTADVDSVVFSFKINQAAGLKNVPFINYTGVQLLIEVDYKPYTLPAGGQVTITINMNPWIEVMTVRAQGFKVRPTFGVSGGPYTYIGGSYGMAKSLSLAAAPTTIEFRLAP